MENAVGAVENCDNTVLEKYFELIQLAPDEPVRRYVALQILDHILQEQVSVKALREALTAVLSALGPKDTQSRNGILSLLSSDPYLDHVESRQTILEFLPCTILPERRSTADVIQILSSLCQKDETAIVPILDCIALFPEESGREGFLYEVSLQSLPRVGKEDLPVVMRTLLLSVAVEEQATRAWKSIRMALTQFEQDLDSDLLVLEILAFIPYLTNHSEPESGKLLTKVFLRECEACASNHKGGIDFLLVELTAIVSISEKLAYAQRIHRLLDLLVSRGVFPWEQMSTMVRMLLKNKTSFDGGPDSPLIRQISSALLRMSVFLLLAPVRTSVNQDNIDSTTVFVQQVHYHLSPAMQIELAHTLLCLSEEVTAVQTDQPDSPKSRRGRKRKHGAISGGQQCIHRSIHMILKYISESSPNDIARFRNLFVKRLTEPSNCYESKDFCRALCSIIVNLVGQDGFGAAELMTILQNLLFSTSDIHGSYSASNENKKSRKIVRGFVLATEMVQSPIFNENQRTTIHKWILDILLPSSRQTVDPELGCSGLSFLRAWKNLRKDNKVFQHLKIILSNTCLIQLASFYQENKRTDAVQGYGNLVADLNLFRFISPKKNVREMMFCVESFLRRLGSNRPSTWNRTRIWVVDLVDEYLTEGRKSGSNWHAEGWLMAAIEFPVVSFPSDTQPETRRPIEQWFVKNLCHFDLSTTNQNEMHLSHEKSFQYISSLSAKQYFAFQASLLNFVLSLIISVSISTTVLVHSFQQLQNVAAITVDSGMNDTSSEDRSFVLIKAQLMKIYDLMNKLDTIESLLCAMRSYEGKSTFTSKPSRKDVATGETKTYLKLMFLTAEENNFSEAISQLQLFREAHRRSQNLWRVLWWCLLDDRNEEALKEFIRSYATGLSQQSPVMTMLEFSRIISLQTSIIGALATYIANSHEGIAQIERTQVQHCSRMTFFILDTLPTLRKTFIKMDDGEKNELLLSVVNLGESYSFLLSVILYDAFIRSKGSASDNHWNQTIEWLDTSIATLSPQQTTISGKRMSSVSSVFCFLKERLVKTEYSKIASQILDILSILALQGSRELLPQAIILSWISLHTIFVDRRDGIVKEQIPWSLRVSFQVVCEPLSALQSLQQSVHGKIQDWFNDSKKRDCVFIFLRQGLLRHWGLLLMSSDSSSIASHLSDLIVELSLFLRKWDRQVIGGDEENDSDDEFSDSGRKDGPFIFGLEPGTMLDYFELVLFFVIGAATSSQIVITSKDREPYKYIIDLLHKFQQLVELYMEFFSLFPPGAASSVASACRDMLELSLLQTQQCVEWRSTQPLISVSEKEANVFDPGSVSHLEKLLNEVSSRIVSTVLSLCDFWQRENSRLSMSRCSNLRIMAEKSARRLRTICFDVNLTSPSFNQPSAVLRINQRVNETKGFHELDLSSKSQNSEVYMPSQIRHKRKLKDEYDSLSGDDNDSEFCVSGGWGISSNGFTESTLSLNVLTQQD